MFTTKQIFTGAALADAVTAIRLSESTSDVTESQMKASMLQMDEDGFQIVGRSSRQSNREKKLQKKAEEEAQEKAEEEAAAQKKKQDEEAARQKRNNIIAKFNTYMKEEDFVGAAMMLWKLGENDKLHADMNRNLIMRKFDKYVKTQKGREAAGMISQMKSIEEASGTGDKTSRRMREELDRAIFIYRERQNEERKSTKLEIINEKSENDSSTDSNPGAEQEEQKVEQPAGAQPPQHQFLVPQLVRTGKQKHSARMYPCTDAAMPQEQIPAHQGQQDLQHQKKQPVGSNQMQKRAGVCVSSQNLFMGAGEGNQHLNFQQLTEEAKQGLNQLCPDLEEHSSSSDDGNTKTNNLMKKKN